MEHLDPEQTRPCWQTLPRLRMSHVRLSLILMPLSSMDFQLPALKHMMSAQCARFKLQATILLPDSVFALLSYHQKHDVIRNLVKLS